VIDLILSWIINDFSISALPVKRIHEEIIKWKIIALNNIIKIMMWKISILINDVKKIVI